MNKTLGKPIDQPPATSRVLTRGVGASWKHYFNEDPQKRKKRRKTEYNKFEQKIKDVEKKAVTAAREECQVQIKALVPVIAQWIREHPGEEFPIPSFNASNSMNIHEKDENPDGREAQHSSPSSVSGMPGTGAATLAEIDIVTVTN